MKIIIPMAGQGKRMRPHTLTTPKPLLPIAGKPIVQRLVEDIAALCNDPIDEIAFIIGDFGKEVETQLHQIAEQIGARARICFQEEALGTAHAVLCAQESLDGEVIVAFADTLFNAQFNLDKSKDGTIWVNSVQDPSAFGVVTLNEQGVINAFVEKPETFVSDLAIIGIYYFKDGKNLRKELEYLIQNNIKEKGEYQLTNALENMKSKGLSFVPGKVEEWLDCGNKNATVFTNQRVLINRATEFSKTLPKNANNVTLIEPCYIAEGVELQDCKIGPYVSIGNGCKISNCTLSNTIIQNHCIIKDTHISDSMIGNHVIIEGKGRELPDLSLGDYSTIGL